MRIGGPAVVEILALCVPYRHLYKKKSKKFCTQFFFFSFNIVDWFVTGIVADKLQWLKAQILHSITYLRARNIKADKGQLISMIE